MDFKTFIKIVSVISNTKDDDKKTKLKTIALASLAGGFIVFIIIPIITVVAISNFRLFGMFDVKFLMDVCAMINCTGEERTFYDKVRTVDATYKEKYNVDIDETLLLTTINYTGAEIEDPNFICNIGDCSIPDDDIDINNPNGIIEQMASSMVNVKYNGEKVTYSISIDGYTEYLANDYIPNVTPSIAEDSAVAMGELAEEIVEYSNNVKEAYLKSQIESDYGISDFDIGEAGDLTIDIIDQLYDPLGGNNCSQTSCYGNYSKNDCNKHNGVDVVSPGDSAAPLYAIADGYVTYLSNYSASCDYRRRNDLDYKAYYDSAQCDGRVITIAHDVMVNGRIVKLKSTYAHLASFANSNWPTMMSNKQPIFIKKGEMIGIMGKTGRITGIHLHFKLTDVNNKRYNPENLFYYKGCRMDTEACRIAREWCSLN